MSNALIFNEFWLNVICLYRYEGPRTTEALAEFVNTEGGIVSSKLSVSTCEPKKKKNHLVGILG